jgi:hypothetical protein
LDWGYKQGCAFAQTSKCLPTVDAAIGIGSPPHFYGTTQGDTGDNFICTTGAWCGAAVPGVLLHIL